MRCRCNVCLIVLCVFLASSLIFAEDPVSEIWISPTYEMPDKVVGTWPLTSSGLAHFSFVMPHNMTDFAGAKVLVISKKDASCAYQLTLSIAQNEQRHDEFVTSQAYAAMSFQKDTLAEIDISSIIPSTLYPGLDYASLEFQTIPAGFVQVVGLCFQYVGPVGPQGPQGVPGEPGGLSLYEQVSVSKGIPGNLGSGSVWNVVVQCPSGKKVLGGGIRLSGNVPVLADVRVFDSRPLSDTSWIASAIWVGQPPSPNENSVTLTGYAVCASAN